jgi:hypothetical protein
MSAKRILPTKSRTHIRKAAPGSPEGSPMRNTSEEKNSKGYLKHELSSLERVKLEIMYAKFLMGEDR